jgi:uncharacterized protein YegJ (DUF2314 family)
MFIRFRIAIIAASLITACGSAFALDPNPVPKVPKGDPAMAAAFARASATLDGFLAKWRKPPPGAEGFTVKIGLMDIAAAPGYALVKPDSSVAEPVEWFWTNALRQEGDGFTGEIGNDAELLHNVSGGQTVHFKQQDIGDWMYFQDGKIVGNATACPALAHASSDERRQMKEQYGIDCD